MITHRKRQELIDSIELLPGHKQRFIELFRRIDNVSKKCNNFFNRSIRRMLTDQIIRNIFTDVPETKCPTHRR